jgi:ABC-type oligopeptide transport system substrate-binding subunit
MRSTNRRNPGLLALVAAAAAAAAIVAGCGSSSKSSSPPTLSLKISEKGKKASYQVPKSATGGLITVNLINQGKAPHGVEFVQYTGSHTAGDVLK